MDGAVRRRWRHDSHVYCAMEWGQDDQENEVSVGDSESSNMEGHQGDHHGGEPEPSPGTEDESEPKPEGASRGSMYGSRQNSTVIAVMEVH